jgi:hypothetical protein
MAHTTSSRTEEQPDGTIGAFVVVDGEEFWLGTFATEKLAQIDIDRMIDTREAAWASEPQARETA